MPRDRNASRARRVAKDTYTYRHCVICGRSHPQVAHLDQDRRNDTPDNLVYLCPTDHVRYDRNELCREAVLAQRDHLERTGGAHTQRAHTTERHIAGPDGHHYRLFRIPYQLVAQMLEHEGGRHPNRAAFMREYASRIGPNIRTGSPKQFVEDLLAAGMLQELRRTGGHGRNRPALGEGATRQVLPAAARK